MSPEAAVASEAASYASVASGASSGSVYRYRASLSVASCTYGRVPEAAPSDYHLGALVSSRPAAAALFDYALLALLTALGRGIGGPAGSVLLTLAAALMGCYLPLVLRDSLGLRAESLVVIPYALHWGYLLVSVGASRVRTRTLRSRGGEGVWSDEEGPRAPFSASSASILEGPGGFLGDADLQSPYLGQCRDLSSPWLRSYLAADMTVAAATGALMGFSRAPCPLVAWGVAAGSFAVALYHTATRAPHSRPLVALLLAKSWALAALGAATAVPLPHVEMAGAVCACFFPVETLAGLAVDLTWARREHALRRLPAGCEAASTPLLSLV